MAVKPTRQAATEREIAQAVTAVVNDMICKPLLAAGYSKEFVFRMVRSTLDRAEAEIEDD